MMARFGMSHLEIEPLHRISKRSQLRYTGIYCATLYRLGRLAKGRHMQLHTIAHPVP